MRRPVSGSEGRRPARDRGTHAPDPPGRCSRGRASIYQEDQVRVFLDHVPVDDLQILKQVAASDILTIEVLTGLDATTHYGAGSTTGAIVISTSSGRP